MQFTLIHLVFLSDMSVYMLKQHKQVHKNTYEHTLHGTQDNTLSISFTPVDINYYPDSPLKHNDENIILREQEAFNSF